MNIRIVDTKEFSEDAVIDLYVQNKWSSAEKPKELIAALKNSHTVILAYDRDQLVGLANAISDGHLVVYYPHLLVLPAYQQLGIGKLIMEKMDKKYHHLHQQILVADKNAIGFYKKCGFVNAGECKPMWIYDGQDHE